MPIVWEQAPYVKKGLSVFLDEDGVELISYAIGFMTVWLVLFLALNFVIDHMKMFKPRIVPFPVDPAREPLPKEEAN